MQQIPRNDNPVVSSGLRPPAKPPATRSTKTQPRRRAAAGRVERSRRRDSALHEWTVEKPDPGLIREVEARFHAKTRLLFVVVVLGLLAGWTLFGFFSSMTPMWPQAKEALHEDKDVLWFIAGGLVGFYFSRR